MFGKWTGTYLEIELIELLDSRLDVSSMNRVADADSLIDILGAHKRLNAGFYSEVLRCARITLIDQIIHDNRVNIAVCVSNELS